ncbi:HAMP domain-containing sensor histidine kinase [Streptomyces sodiiphilus]|uniref:Signal transduction histidine-protein kinase/phosphatase MprB n=1 Tax=Streptomyces sodiiphilus TaxID=226217 RepID=A0ABN2PSX8_9ACTN
MRWALVRIALAVTSMVTLAFAVPLGLVVKEMVGDRALADAERQAAAIGPALAITTDREQLRRAVASTRAGAEGRIAVHLPAGGEGREEEGREREGGDEAGAIGRHRVSGSDLREAAELGRAATVEVEGGVSLLQPTAVGGGRIAVVEVFVPAAALTAGVGTSWLVLAGVGLALVIGSVAVADRLGRRTVRPAEQLASAARELGEGRLEVRVPEQGPAELRAAAAAFNAMAGQVTRLLANERELAADLSHRLRTPLTVLRLNAASLGEGDAAEQTRQAVEHLEREVDGIIRGTREQRAAVEGAVRERAGGRPAGTDAAAVIRERMDFWSALAEDEGRQVRLAGVDRPLRVPVASAELTAALDALLGNIFRHTPEGTPFAVDVHHVEAENAVIVLVSDAGPGIADPAAALRRGHGDGGPGSTGLGLDIVRRVAESTGGDVTVGRSVLGGAEVRLWLSLEGAPGGPRAVRPSPPAAGPARVAVSRRRAARPTR